jgi:hypothetical protein
MTTTNANHDPMVLLDPDEADDLARLLRQLEDWLRHAGADTYDDLVEFFNGPGHGQLAVAGLIQVISDHAITLHRRCQELVQ